MITGRDVACPDLRGAELGLKNTSLLSQELESETGASWLGSFDYSGAIRRVTRAVRELFKLKNDGGNLLTSSSPLSQA